jgi:hypothetical protein
MATRGSIPKMMELAGIDMLPPEAGIPLIRRELTAGGTRGEIVIGQRLGVLMNEWDAEGGLDRSAAKALLDQPGLLHGPMIGVIAGMDLYRGLTVETTLDPKTQPFLYDHQIEGTPVLPGVMGIEAFAEAASWMLPGWHIVSVEDVNFLAPFKFYRNEPRTLAIRALLHAEGDAVVADCRLTGSRTLPNQNEPQVTTHFTARVRLSKQLQSARSSTAVSAPADSIIEAANIYHLYFHGPAYQVLARAWRDEEQVVGQFAKGLPNNHVPSDLPLAIAPRLIELCFQTAGLWEMSALGRLGLPHYIREVALSRGFETAPEELYAVVTPRADAENFDAEILDKAGNQYLHLSGYRTIALPNRVDAEPLIALQAVTV